MFHRKLVDAAADCIGSPNVVLHGAKAHIFECGPECGYAYPPHQDYLHYPQEKDSLVCCFIYLDDSCKENGGMAFFPGTHKLGPLPDFSKKPGAYICDPEQFPMEKALTLNMKKGDVLIFSYLTVHMSNPNFSNRYWRMLTYQVWYDIMRFEKIQACVCGKSF